MPLVKAIHPLHRRKVPPSAKAANGQPKKGDSNREWVRKSTENTVDQKAQGRARDQADPSKRDRGPAAFYPEQADLNPNWSCHRN